MVYRSLFVRLDIVGYSSALLILLATSYAKMSLISSVVYCIAAVEDMSYSALVAGWFLISLCREVN